MDITGGQIRRIRSLFYRLILVALIAITGYVLYRSIFQIKSAMNQNHVVVSSELHPAILILGMVIYIVCFKQLYCLFSKRYFNDRRTLLMGAGISVVFLACLLWTCSYITVNPTYDLSHIRQTIYAKMTGNQKLNNDYYYSRYPNNIPLFVVMNVIMKVAGVFGVTDLSLVGKTMACFMLAITAFLSFLTARKTHGNNMALLVLSIFVTNPLFYLYSSYYYTDVLCMPFALFAIYMFACFWKSEQRGVDYWKLLAAGVAIGVGYEIRAVVIILFVAIMVWTFTRARIKTTMKVVLVVVIGMAPIFLAFKVVNTTGIMPIDRNLQFPVTHWLMMGLNEESGGKFNGEDFELTNGCETYEEKVAVNKKEIVRRVKEQGFSGLLAHSKEKLAIVWADGYSVPTTFKYVESYNKVFDYTLGTRNIFMRYYAQICRCALFFLLLIHFINRIMKAEAVISMWDLAILGAYIFYLLWEAGERYAVSFIPWMLLVMIEGVRLVDVASKKETIKCGKRVWRRSPILTHAVVSGVVVASSIFVMVSSYSTYTQGITQYTDDAFVLPKAKIKKRGIRIDGKELAQNFSTHRPFNQMRFEVSTQRV